MKLKRTLLRLALCATALTSLLRAHPMNFSSTISYGSSQPAGGAASVANWTGAAYDAANIGGSGANADGGADNGAANDATTYVANDRPRQGQTFTTGSNVHGYDLTAITVRMSGYTNNTATGNNRSGWNLNLQNGPLVVEIGRVNGADFTTLSKQNFVFGGTGTPGTGQTASGAGAYITFNLPFSVHLEPNTTYGFDFFVGNGSANYFEWLGLSTQFAPDPYAEGAAYTREWWGGPITPLAGERVFQANLTASTAPHAPFVHPGALHTQADFDRMAAKVSASAQPWKGSFDVLAASPWAQTGWPAYDVDYIVRGSSGNNYTRSQQDAQAIYELALRWKLTGDTAFADKAVQIANVWSGLLGLQGDTNRSLAAGICGYLFAAGGEILTTYPGWPQAQQQAYKDMMMRVFYPENFDFLWRHHDTHITHGGSTHYRLNWETANMASMAAIGILCDNEAVYRQAVDFFKFGPGNGRVDRAAWYVFPEGIAQTEESGRDQAHNLGGWYAMALLCQMAWNQGDDLFGYDNNRVLRAYEYNAKYNLWNDDVPWTFHRNASLGYTETLSGAVRGVGQYYQYELVYNHYARVKGIAAPWSKRAVDATRPEPRPDPALHPSQVDWLGLGSLTFARDPLAAGAAPSGLAASWSKNQVVLRWWGSADATEYQIKRATSAAGPYATLGTVADDDLNFTDATVSNSATYHYIVTALTPGGPRDSAPLRVARELVTRYTFEGDANDSVGARHGTLQGGVSAPGFTTGFGGGQAVSLNGSDQYVQLPIGSGNYQDITIATWVYWNGGGNWQRIFDFGTEIEKYMMLTPSTGANLRFSITTSRGTDGTGTLNGPVLATGQWVHVAVTLNGDAGTLYVNGSPVDTQPITAVDPLFGQPFCYLGRSMYNGDPRFNGRIDDFRIYNHALSGGDVYALWGQGGANSAPAFTSDPIVLADATEDANYSAFGLSLASHASDANGGTLTYAKVAGPAWLTVASDGALSGTPTNADVGENLFVVRVTDSSGATDDANLRIIVSNTNDAPVWALNPITKADATQGLAYAASLAADAADVDAGDALTFAKVAGPAWLAVAADGSVSGTPGNADVGVNAFTVRVTDSVGAQADATLNVTVRPLSITSRYAFENNPDDDAGLFPGTATGTPAYAAGRIGQAIVLDGVDDYVALPAGAASHTNITLATWVYWNSSATQWQRIFDFGTGTANYLYLSPRSGSNTLRFAIANGGGEQQLNTTQLATGQWVHLAVTLGGNTATLYVNGAVAATNTAITLTPAAIAPTLNYIGKSQFADPLFNGLIDDFRIYNYVLSSADVQALASVAPVPSAPTGLNAIAGNTQVSLSWSASSGAVGYRVKRATVSGGPYTLIANDVAGTGYTNTGLSNDTTYHYVVSAVNAVGESADSTQVSATPQVPPPAAPAGLSATAGDTQVSLAWSAAPGATSYTVKRAAVSGGPYTTTVAVGVTATTYVDTGLTNGTTYHYVVSASNAGGEGANSAQASATPQPPAPAAPTGLGATAGNAQVSLAWSAASGATSYTVKRATVSGGPYTTTVATGVTATTYIDAGLTNGTTYHYVVSAVNGGGESADSAQASATPQPSAPAAPAGLVATALSSTRVNLSWSASAGATSYTVKRATVSGGPYATVASGLATTTAIDTGLAATTTYYYVVTATNAGGESAGSAEASAITTDLRARYTFDETSGTSAADSAGDALNGTLVNGPLWSVGALNNAVDLDGANDHVTLPAGVVNGLTQFTIGTWVYLDAVSNWSRVFDFGTGTAVNMFLTPRGGTNVVRYAITTGGGAGEQQINGTSALPVGAWTHVAVTWSGNVGILYVNGVEVGRNSAMTLTPSALGATTLNYIGRSQYADPYLNGRVDDFRIHARALSASELAALVAAGMPAPAAPTALGATAASTSQINLSWTASPGATSYTVKRSSTSGGPYATIATGITAATFADTGLAASTAYHYVVSAVNVGGESADSIQASATTQTPPPATPASLSATAVSTTQINLSWSAASGATSYTVKRATTSGGPYSNVATGVSGTAFGDTGLSPDTAYYYVVSAVNIGGESADSAQASATTPMTPPAAPTGLSATAGNAQVSLSWSAASGAASYTIKRATTSGGPYSNVATGVTATTYLNTGLTNGTTYHYVVSAVNTGGESANSAQASATPQVPAPAAPTGLSATAGNTEISLSWSAASGATSYTVKRATTSGGPYSAVASGVTATTYVNTGLTNGTAYHYVVSAVNAGGESANSAQASATPVASLPSPWVTADIGAVGAAGGASYSAPTFTILGSGADIWSGADEFHYVSQAATGDCSITVRVASMTNTNSQAKAGIMIRESTAANARYAGVFITPTSGVRFQRRTSTGGTTSNNSVTGVAAPRWIRLTRTGNTFSAFYSSNGTTWTQISNGKSITMATGATVGIGVSSRADGTLCTGVFDNVTAAP